MADPDEKRAAKTFAAYPERAEVQRFPAHVRQRDQEHRRGAGLLPGPHARHRRDVGDGARQTRLLSEAADPHRLGGAAVDRWRRRSTGVATQMGNQGYSQVGARECCEIIWNGDIGNVTEVHAWTNRPDPYWPQGPDVVPKEEPVPSDARLGRLAGQTRKCGPTARPTCRTTGAPSRISAAARSATWPATSWARPIWRCGSARRTASSASRWKASRKYTFPYRIVIRFDFPARGGMPAAEALLVRPNDWRSPRSKGVPEGELLGDKDINGSLFIGDKGMVTTGCYGERTRLVPGRKNEGLQDAAAGSAALPGPRGRLGQGPLSRLDSRRQGRRAGLLEFQRRRAVRAVDAAGRDRHAGGRQADVGRGKEALHQQ